MTRSMNDTPARTMSKVVLAYYRKECTLFVGYKVMVPKDGPYMDYPTLFGKEGTTGRWMPINYVDSLYSDITGQKYEI